MQTAVASLDPMQAARWRTEAGHGLSLGAAAAKAGISEMTNAQHEELMSLDADFRAGEEEAAARREADLLASLESGAAKLAEAREKQQAQFQRQGPNNSGGAYTRDFVQRWGNLSQQQKTPARRLLGK